MGAPLMQAEQDRSIGIEDLPPEIVRGLELCRQDVLECGHGHAAQTLDDRRLPQGRS